LCAIGMGWAAIAVHPACFFSAVLYPEDSLVVDSKEVFKLFCLLLGGSVAPPCTQMKAVQP